MKKIICHLGRKTPKLFNLVSMSIVAVLLLSSCQKDAEETVVITDDEIAEMISTSVTTNSQASIEEVGGEAYEARYIESAPAEVQADIADCAQEKRDTFQRNGEGTFVKFDINASYSVAVECVGQIPNKITSDVSLTGYFESRRVKSTGALDGNIVVGYNVREDPTIINVNGTFVQSAQVDKLIGEKKSFSTKSTITFTNIELSVPYLVELTEIAMGGFEPIYNGEVELPSDDFLIHGGVATCSFSGEGLNVANFNVEAEIIYHGDGTATISFNDKSWKLILITGELTVQ